MKVIEALNDHVIVDVLEQVEELTEGGIVIPETTSSKPQSYGYVLSVGPKVVSALKSGDTIIFAKFGGQTIMNGKKTLKVLKEGEIYGKLLTEEGN
jgi:co-chaperonin GroES (HSP10)